MIGKVCKENDQFPFTPLVFCVLVLNVVHNWLTFIALFWKFKFLLLNLNISDCYPWQEFLQCLKGGIHAPAAKFPQVREITSEAKTMVLVQVELSGRLTNDITAFQLGAMPSRSCSLTFTIRPQITGIIAQKELINGWQETETRYKNNQNYMVDGNKSNCSLKRNETWRSLAHSNPYSQPCVRKTVCASFVSQTAETALTRIGWENNKEIK